jgi:hypothetical protein
LEVLDVNNIFFDFRPETSQGRCIVCQATLIWFIQNIAIGERSNKREFWILNCIELLVLGIYI